MVREMGHDHLTVIFYNVIQMEMTFDYESFSTLLPRVRHYVKKSSIKIKMVNRPFNLLSNVSREILAKR